MNEQMEIGRSKIEGKNKWMKYPGKRKTVGSGLEHKAHLKQTIGSLAKRRNEKIYLSYVGQVEQIYP